MKKVIIFDDDEDILSICHYILEDQGWEVHTFADCNQLIDRVTAIRPEVILMDNWIPAEGGVAATKTLKNTPELSHIPVVYFSANNNVAELADQAGADSFLAKPFELEDLGRVVNQALVATN